MRDMTSEEPLYKRLTQDDYPIFPTVEPPFLDEEPDEDDHGGTECRRLSPERTRRRVRILSEDAAQALYAQAKAGNKAARNELIERFWPLCHAIAKQYRGDLPHDEATCAATTGLIAAIDGGNFDPTWLDKRGKPIKLATYFRKWLFGAVKKELTKRFPAYETTSLDAPKRSSDGEEFAPDDAPPAGALPEAPPTLEDDLIGIEEAAQDGAAILYSLNTLDDRSRQIFKARCLAEGDRLKLRELAAEHDLTCERVRQIEVVSHKKVSDAVREQALRPRKLCDLGLTPAAAASLQGALATLTDCERHVFSCRRLTRFPARHAVIGRAFGINCSDCLDVEIEATLKVYSLAPAALVQLPRPPERRLSPVTRMLDERELLDIGVSPETALTAQHKQWLGWTFGCGRLVTNWPSEEAIAAVVVGRKIRRQEAAAEQADWRAVLLRSRKKRESDALVQRRAA